jgi:uncharacterized membrane protein YqaE (UPF0057 family)
MEQKLCPICKFGIIEGYVFCPHCGYKLKDAVFEISLSKQIGIYLLSFFLPPLGLFPGISYLRNPDQKAKHVGLIAVFLTILASILTIWATIGFINTVNKTLNQQINIQQLGY